MTALVEVEYVVRLRLLEPPGALPADHVGDTMIELLGEIEMVAVEQEIVSRVVDPDHPPRVRCAARRLDPTRHYATSRRWQIATPDGETVTTCSAACALSWFCHEGAQADVEQTRHDETDTRREVA